MSHLTTLITVLALTTTTMTACSPARPDTVVTVLHPWSGTEARAFETILDELDDGESFRVQAVGTSSYRQVLELGRGQGEPADIVVLPSLGELAEYAADRLVRPITVPDERPYPWNVWERLGSPSGPRYAVTVKAQLKSLTWSTGTGGWCMGVGDASAPGWPGTDWVEDILLSEAGALAYREWTAGRDLPWTDPRVESAWNTWLDDYVSTVPGGPTAVLLNRFADRPPPLLAPNGSCERDRRSSYILSDYQGFTAHRFSDREAVVSADFAALVTDKPAAAAVLSELATKDTQRKWLTSGSGFPIDPDVRRAGGGPAETLIQDVLARPDALCFDASDSMPVTERTAFEQAVLTVLQNPERLRDVLNRLQRVRGTVTEPRLDLPCATAR